MTDIHGRRSEVQEKAAAGTGRDSLEVLMIAPTSFFSDYGGHIRILEEARVLEPLGIKVTIVTYFQGRDVENLTIHRTRPLPWHADYEVGSSRHKLAFDIYLLAKVLQEGFKIKPDIVHGHMHEGALIGAVLARLKGIPLVFDFQGGLSAEMVDHRFLDPDGIIFPWVRRLERFICNLPDAILTSSQRAQGILADQFGVHRDIIHELPDCVDTQFFNPARFGMAEKLALRRQLRIPDDRPIVVYLGLLADYQGTPQLIEAAAHLLQNGADIHFLVMGFPRIEQYREMARGAGIDASITFTGKIDYKLAPNYLSIGDLAVSTKMSSTEGSGKVLNYMAMAQPVAAFDTPVHREYLGELGCYAPARDSAALAKVINTLAVNREESRKLGEELRRRAVAEFSWQSAGKRIMNLYVSLTSN